MKSFIVLIITSILCSLLFTSFALISRTQQQEEITEPSYVETIEIVSTEPTFIEETVFEQEETTVATTEAIEETTVEATIPETESVVEPTEKVIDDVTEPLEEEPQENTERFQKGDIITANIALNFRDSMTYELIVTAAENVYFEYISQSANYPERIEVYYHGKQGTILNSDKLRKLPDFEKDTYFATNPSTDLNLRVSTAESEPIAIIPCNSAFEVLGTLNEDSSRVLVLWQNQYGTLAKSYIEKVIDSVIINRSIQKLFLIRNEELILTTDCVTGQPQHAPTPAGHFKIWHMSEKQTLRGTNWSSGLPYAVPVDYLMAFYGDYCMHDNSGRNAFGGNIYKSSGSNGCVNLPYESAKFLYENAYVGLSVIVF